MGKQVMLMVDVFLFVSWVAAAGYCAGGGVLGASKPVLYAYLAVSQLRLIVMSTQLIGRELKSEPK